MEHEWWVDESEKSSTNGTTILNLYSHYFSVVQWLSKQQYVCHMARDVNSSVVCVGLKWSVDAKLPKAKDFCNNPLGRAKSQMRASVAAKSSSFPWVWSRWIAPTRSQRGYRSPPSCLRWRNRANNINPHSAVARPDSQWGQTTIRSLLKKIQHGLVTKSTAAAGILTSWDLTV